VLAFLNRSRSLWNTRGTYRQEANVASEYSNFHPHRDPLIFRNVVEEAIKDLEPIKDEFDSIAVIGASGTVVGSVVAYLMRKNLVVVRKVGENPNCEQHVTGNHWDVKRTVFLDDFVCGGNTLQRVIEVLRGRPAFAYMYYRSPFFAVRAEVAGYMGIRLHLFKDVPTTSMSGRFAYPAESNAKVEVPEVVS